MAVTYSPAPEAEAIARELIADYHPHLETQRVDLIFRSEAAKKHGKFQLGAARKVSGLPAYLDHAASQRAQGRLGRHVGPPLGCEDFFVIELAQPEWEHLTPAQRRALVDHELCHLGVDEDGNSSIVSHDVEEFGAVLERHGLWEPDVSQFIRAGARQLGLFESVPSDREPVSVGGGLA